MFLTVMICDKNELCKLSQLCHLLKTEMHNTEVSCMLFL
uniref:Uncharacterized protein n=1 Tax=Anguilla anguilla TaxID=7936 RepID=A0A0E9SSH8_ANGAN